MAEEAKPSNEPSWKKPLDHYFSDEGFEVRFEYQETEPIFCVKFSPRAIHLAYIVSKSIKIYKNMEKKLIHTIKDPKIIPTTIEFLNDRTIIIGGDKGQIRVFDFEGNWSADAEGRSQNPCLQILFSKIHSSIYVAHAADGIVEKFTFNKDSKTIDLVSDFRLTNLSSFDVSEDEKTLVLSSETSVSIISIHDEKILNNIPVNRKNSSLEVTILNKTKEVAFTINKYTVAFYSIDSGDHLKEIEDPRRMEIIGISFFQDENYMLTMTEDGYMRIFDLKKMEDMTYLSVSSQIFRSKKLLIAPNLKYIGMLTHKNQIKCWDLLSTDHTEIFKSPYANLGTIRFLFHLQGNLKSIKLFRVTSKNRLITGATDGTLSIYDLNLQKTIFEVKEPGTECINGLVVTKDEKNVIIGGKDKRYRIFEMNSDQTSLTIKHCSGPFVDSILEIALFEDGSHFIVCVKGGIMQVTNTETRQPVEIIHGDWWAHESVYHNICAIKDNVIVIGNDSGTLNIFSLKNNFKEQKPIESIHLTSIKSLAADKDGRFVITGGKDPYLQIIDLESGKTKMIKLPRTHYLGEIHCLEMSTNKRFVLITTSESISIYDLEGGHRVHTEFVGGINHAGFTPDNKGVYIALSNGEFRLEKFPFLSPEQKIFVLDYSFEVPFRAMSSIPYMKLRRLFNGEEILTDKLIKSYQNIKIIPYNINLWNFYTFILDSEEIPKITNMIIDAEVPIVNDNDEMNIFTYLLEANDIVTLNVINKRAAEALKNSPEEVYFTLSQKLPGLLSTFLPSLPNLLDSCISSPEPVRGEPPVRMFGNSSPWTSHVFADSTRISLEEQNQLSTAAGHDHLRFKVSRLSFNSQYTSETNLKILDSIYQNNNLDIYKSEMVQRIIDFAWTQAYPTLTITFLFNLAFLVVFSVSLGYQIIPVELTITVLAMNTFLSVYEIIQLCSRPRDYLTSGWNLIDLAKNALIYVSFYLNFKKTQSMNATLDASEDEAKIVCSSLAVLFVYLKMISYFSILKPTRYLIRVINEVIRDMASFILILVFIIFAWALIFFQIEANGAIGKITSLPKQFLNVYLIIFSSFQSEYTGLERPFFILVSFFVSIILLNLLISIISDTYQRVQSNLIPSDNLEKLGILIEIISVRVFISKFRRCFKEKRRDKKYYQNKFKYLMWVTENEDDSGNMVQSKEGTLTELHRIVKAELDKIKEEGEDFNNFLQSKVDIAKETQKIVNQLNLKQERLRYNIRELTRKMNKNKKENEDMDNTEVAFHRGHTINLPK